MNVKAQLADVQSVLKTLSENQASLTDTVSTIANMTAKQPAVPNVVPAISDQPSTSNVASQLCRLFGSKDEEEKWFVQTMRKRDKKPLRRIIGGNSSTDLKVKAVAGSSEWHLFD